MRLNQQSEHPEIVFEGGTNTFFGRFWGIGAEWLYAWTPDGWFESPGFRSAPLELLNDAEADPETDPRWLEINQQAAAFQTPLPLATVIRQYEATRRGNPCPNER